MPSKICWCEQTSITEALASAIRTAWRGLHFHTVSLLGVARAAATLPWPRTKLMFKKEREKSPMPVRPLLGAVLDTCSDEGLLSLSRTYSAQRHR
jgi:hypothetical protein